MAVCNFACQRISRNLPEMVYKAKQRYLRTRMVLPVRVSPESTKDQSAEATLAHTVDISPVGAQLGGVRISLEPGETIVLQHRHSKGSFRVIWTREIGPAEVRAGVEWLAIDKSIGTEINFWGLELPTRASAGSLPSWLQKYE
jgi:hypothetical protein